MTYGHHITAMMFVVHIGYIAVMFTGGIIFSHRQFERRLSK